MAERPQPQGPIPHLMLDNAAEAITLYEKAFGGELLSRINYPNDESKVMHACIKIGGGPVFIGNTHPQRFPTPTNSSFYLLVKDVDAAFATAKKAGLTELSAPTDMFWGDRMGSLRDKFGVTWALAQHKQELSLDEIKKAAKQQAA